MDAIDFVKKHCNFFAGDEESAEEIKTPEVA
jgi:hypothetical protein